MFKKLLPFLAFVFLIFPAVAFATPTSWDYASGILQPLQSQWAAVVKGSYFQATSTTASIFPYASTTAVSVSSLSGGDCVQAGTGGLLTTSGAPCGSGSGGLASTTPWDNPGDAFVNSLGLIYSSATSSASTAYQNVWRDSNANAFANNFLSRAESTVSAGGTTVLTAGSARAQRLTGSSNQTFQLPDATTLSLGVWFMFDNNSSGSLIVKDAGGNTLYTTPAGGYVQAAVTSTASANGGWDFHPYAPSTVTWGSGITGLVMNSALSTSPSILAGASSSAAPSFIPQRGTATTGFGGDGSSLFLTTAGTARLTVTSAGKVGIATTSPWVGFNVYGAGGEASTTVGVQNAVAKFTVGNTSLDTGRSNLTPFAWYFQARADNISASPYPIILNPVGGSVGIGTSSPLGTLSVQTSSGSDILYLGRLGSRYLSLDFNGATANFETDAIPYWQTGSGEFLVTTNRTDATQKDARLGVPHYTNAEEPFLFGLMSSTATTNIMQLGGGSVLGNAATSISFYTAANNTTTTGTERMRIDSAGNVGIGTTTPYALLSIGGDTVIGASTAGGTLGDLYLPKLGTAAGTFLAVDATGKVIATTTPSGGGGTVTSVGITNGGGLSVSGSPITTSGSITVTLNTSNANTWNALQTFSGNASSTQLTTTGSTYLATTGGNLGVGTTSPAQLFSVGNGLANGGLYFSGTGLGIGTSTPAFPLSVVPNLANIAANFYISATGKIVGYDSTNGWNGVISPTRNLALSTATTTTWTASTTGPYINTVVMPFAGTIRTAKCTTDTGTLNVDIYHTSTHLALFNASTTVGTVSFASNNTVTAGEKLYMVAGTPASTPTSLSCTLGITETP